MPPAALISLTASFAPLAAGRASADSSPVSAKPPPIFIVPPLLGALPPGVGAALRPAGGGAVDGALDPPELLHAATSAIMAASTKPRTSWVRIMPPPPLPGPLVSEPGQCSARFQWRTTPVALGVGDVTLAVEGPRADRVPMAPHSTIVRLCSRMNW